TASYSGFVNGDTVASSVTGAPSLTTTATATYPAPGTYTITSSLGNLASSNYDFTFVNGTLTVYNVAPVIVMSTGTITLSPGDGFTRPGSFSDPGSVVTGETWTMTINYSDGTGSHTTSVSPSSFTIGDTFSNPGTYTVTMTVADNYGGSETWTFLVKVAAPPVLGPVATQTVTHGNPLSLPFSFTDTPNTTGYTYSINWGDPGSGTGNTQTGSASVGSSGTGTFNGLHMYKHKGTYTVFVTVTDATGVNDTISFQVNAI